MKNTHNNKRYRVKSKFRFITFIVIMLGLTIGAFGIVSGLYTSTALTVPEYTTVQIEAGDTLWDIAGEHMDDGTDPRRAVYEICRVNDINAGDIKPGMILSIPVNL
ncbi:MAG: LysM peptidoglycan-binding domain-containing protein [Lentihominibacter sp.]|jgi:nucleoid-associated protein YgaU